MISKLTQNSHFFLAAASGKRFSQLKVEANTIKNQSAASSAYLPKDKKSHAINPILQQLLHKQKRSRKHQLTDQQRQLDLLARITDPSFSRAEAQRRKSQMEAKAAAALTQTKELIAEMDTAHDTDHHTLNEVKKGLSNDSQAMNRFNLLPKASQILSNKDNQLIFLEQAGCAILEKWLWMNPDGTYPPVQVVEFVLEVLKQLPIEMEHLQECEIARALQIYACDRPKMGQSIS